MKTFPEPLSKTKEAFLIRQMESGDSSAKDTLIIHNMRLVAHIAKKYISPERDSDDIISIGSIGLIKAVSTYNSQRGGKLVTYACKCIENEILMYLRSEKRRKKDVSLYEPVGTDKEGNAIELIDLTACEMNDFIDEYDESQKIRWLYENMSKILSPLELDIIYKRFGLFGQKEATQQTLASEYGISRSYISRIEKRCLQKLKKAYMKS